MRTSYAVVRRITTLVVRIYSSGTFKSNQRKLIIFLERFSFISHILYGSFKFDDLNVTGTGTHSGMGLRRNNAYFECCFFVCALLFVSLELVSLYFIISLYMRLTLNMFWFLLSLSLFRMKLAVASWSLQSARI